ncbi:MAG: tetratricopeptide repeat protein [Treponema sp.]|nr:tetratricopeptide repeat protein [Treponema sp.]
MTILEEIVSEYEGPAEAFLFLGRALHAVRDHSRALAALNDYIALRPQAAAGYFFAGRTCLVLGFYHRAVRLFERALKRDKKNPFTMSFLALAHMKARHSQAAVDMFQAAVEAAPDNRRIYRAYLNALFIRGIRLCRLEEYDLGSQMLRFVLENSGEQGFRSGPLLHLELGRAYRELGRLDDAVEQYSRALEFSPDDSMIRWYRSSILMELERNDEALEDLSIIRSLEQPRGMELPDLPWNSELVDRYMILSFIGLKKWRHAADACRDWIKKRGHSPAIHAMYAEVQRNMKAYQAAENHLMRAIGMDGKNLELWYAMALCAWEGRDFNTLKRVLYKTRQMGGDPEILSRFSLLYESETSQNPQRTLTLLQKAVHTLGPEPELLYALGKSYLRVGLLEEAVSWFSKTIELRENHEEAWLGIIAAREALFTEKAPGARSVLEKTYRDYLHIWPTNLALRRDEALFLVQVREYEKAAKKLEALLAWDPANPGLRRVLAYSYRKAGRYRSAAIFLKALLKERPNDSRLLLEYAGCIERTGGAAYAKAILSKAMDYFSKSSEIPTALGLLAYREGRLERAFELLLEAAARNKKDPRPYRWMTIIAKNKGDREGAERYERQFRAVLQKSHHNRSRAKNIP